MGGVRPTLRPPDSPSARGPGSQHSMAQVAVPGGGIPWPPGAATPQMSRLAPDGSGQEALRAYRDDLVLDGKPFETTRLPVKPPPK